MTQSNAVQLNRTMTMAIGIQPVLVRKLAKKPKEQIPNKTPRSVMKALGTGMNLYSEQVRVYEADCNRQRLGIFTFFTTRGDLIVLLYFAQYLLFMQKRSLKA